MSETGSPTCEWGEKYQTHVRWLKESNFLRDLERDNIDEETIEEELETLRRVDDPLTKQEKVVKFLRSHPVQTVLCAVVLLDACIVIAQVLLDINSVKDRLHQRDEQWIKVLEFIQYTQSSDGHPGGRVPSSSSNGQSSDQISHLLQHLLQHYRSLARESKPTSASSSPTYFPSTSSSSSSVFSSVYSRPYLEQEPIQTGTHGKQVVENGNRNGGTDCGLALSSDGTPHEGENVNDAASAADARLEAGLHVRGGGATTVAISNPDLTPLETVINDEGDLQVARLERDQFREVAYALHLVSVAILGSLVIELKRRYINFAVHFMHRGIKKFCTTCMDLIRITAMGRSVCQHKIEIFDAIVICTAFGLDIVFLGAESGDIGQKAAAALFILLIWRVARVVDGIIIAVKQRQEFRIRLQRRARLKAERNLETAEQEKNIDFKEIAALQNLCLRAGVRQEDVTAVCNNRSPKHQSRMVHALSSVARLSVGMTMSPSFGLLSRHASESCIVSVVRRLQEEDGSSPEVLDRLREEDPVVCATGRQLIGPRRATYPRQAYLVTSMTAVDLVIRKNITTANSTKRENGKATGGGSEAKGAYRGPYCGPHGGPSRLNPRLSRSMEDVSVTSSDQLEFYLNERQLPLCMLSNSRQSGILIDLDYLEH